MRDDRQIKVWDPAVRIIHWTLAGSFFIAYTSGEDLVTLHAWTGYLLLVALLVRVVWGFIGPEYACFSNFVTRPSAAWQYIKDTFSRRAQRYIGHNPAGGLMIVVMLVGLVVTGISGIAVYGADQHAGPMAAYFANGAYAGLKDPLEGIHEFLANGMMLLIVIHVSGVFIEGLLHRENLIRAMWTGYKNPNRNSNSL